MSIEHVPIGTNELEERVASLINERLDILVADPHTDLLATGLLNSLGFVTLLQAIEEEFSVVIGVDELDIDSFRSISSIVAFVSKASRDGLSAPTVLHGLS